MLRTRKTLTVLAIAGALGFAGCGDDDDETTTSTTTSGATGATGATGETGAAVLPEDFIAEADAICAEGDEAIDAEAEEVFGGGGEPTDKEQEDFVADVVVPNVQDQLDQLAALDPPEEGAEEFEQLIEDANAALDEIEADPAAFVEGAASDDPFTDVNKQAQELGLTECGGD